MLRVQVRERESGEGVMLSSHQASIGKYGCLNGIQAAIRHYSKQLEVEVKVASVQTWTTKYLAELRNCNCNTSKWVSSGGFRGISRGAKEPSICPES